MEETLQNAIRSLSTKYNVDPLKFRIKISKPKKDLEYHIMENGETIEQTNLASALNLNTLQAFAAGIKLSSIFDNLSKKDQIERSTMNVRIYTKSEDYSPQLYLFDGTTAVRKIELNELN